MRLIRFKSIRSRLLSTLILALTGVVVLSALVWKFSIEPALQMGVAKNQQEVAQRAADQIQQFIDQRTDGLIAAAEIGRLWEASKEQQKEALYRLLKLDRQIHQLSVVDGSGQEIIRLSRSHVYTDADLASLASEEKFRQAIQGKVHISPVYHALTAEPFITLAVPIKFTATKIKGVLVAEISLKTLWDSIGYIRVGKSGHAYVVNKRGILIAHPDYSKVLLELDMGRLHKVKQFLSPPDHNQYFGEVVIGEGGARVMSTFARVKGLNWAVFVEEPVDTALTEVKQVERMAILLFALIVVGTVMVSYFFSEHIAGPVRKLEQGAKLIAQGNLEHKLEISTGDEIEGLANQFNHMAAELKESHQGLEDKIRERTRDLSALYAAMAPLVSTDGGELLRHVLERLKEATHADAALIRIFHKETESYLYPANVGFPTSYLAATRQMEQDSAIETSFRTGEAIIAADIREDSRLKGKKQLDAGFKSCAFLPLRVSGELRGIIHLASRELGHFTEEKKAHLMAIAQQMGVAMENRELYEEAKTMSREQQALREFLSKLLVLDLDELLHRMTEQAALLFRAEYARVRLLDKQGRIKTRAVAGDKEVVEIMSITGEREELVGRSRQILSGRKPVAINDMAQEVGGRPSRGVRAGLHGSLGAPLLGRDEQPLGIIQMMRRAPGDFSQRDFDLIEQFAQGAAIAIENARLFEVTKKNLQRIQALREIDQAITSRMALRDRLNILLEKIDLFFPHPSATAIRLVNKNTGEVEFLACRHMDEAEWKRRALISPGHRTKQVAGTKTAVTVLNLVATARDPEFYLKEGLVSYIALPLIVKNEAIGVLSLYTKEEHDFTPEEIESLETLVGQAAIAIHEAKLYEETERRRHEAEELARLGQSLTGTLDTTAVAERIVTSVTGLFDVKGSTLRRIEPNGSFRSLASSGDIFSQKAYGQLVPAGLGITSRAVKEGRPMWSADMLDNPEIPLSESMRDYHLQSGNRSIIVAPLRAHEKIIGTLTLSDKTGRSYSEEEVALLQTFADQAALALENARLFDQVREKIEELQQKTSELEKANKAKDEFLSTMSHELRTPLNVVMGYAAMLKDGMLGKINEEQEKALEKVLGRAGDQLQMINTILQATQIGAGAVVANKEAVNLPELLDEIRSNYVLPTGKEITVEWEYACDLPVMQSDRDKIKHILQNLIGNAIKFTEKGRIAISVRYVSELEVIEFEVRDTGVGIPKGVLPVIFERFRQVDSSERREFEGVGLGLYIVKQLTDLLGGKVEVESEEGTGSTFTVTIPAEVRVTRTIPVTNAPASDYVN